MWVDDTPALGLLELRSKVRRLQAEFDRGERRRARRSSASASWSWTTCS